MQLDLCACSLRFADVYSCLLLLACDSRPCHACLAVAAAAEKYKKAAAAARRWREYSRYGVDRRRVMALGDGSSSDSDEAKDREGEDESSKEPALL